MYLSREGTELPSGWGRAARYKVIRDTDECRLYEKVQSTWVQCVKGSWWDITAFFGTAEPTTEVEPEEFYHESVKQIFPKVSYLPGMCLKELSDYIYVALCRNQARQRRRIINLGMLDMAGQFIYILYVGDYNRSISLKLVFPVDSILHASKIYPELAETSLPDPIQWSEDYGDYFWNPAMEILKLSERTVDHITQDRRERLPKELVELPVAVLVRNIRESLYTGQYHVKRDLTYSLPMYSRKYDAINMMLPLRIHTSDNEVPEAVLVLNKTQYGYSLVTIITPKQAYTSVRAFRDPEYTWLRGAMFL